MQSSVRRIGHVLAFLCSVSGCGSGDDSKGSPASDASAREAGDASVSPDSSSDSASEVVAEMPDDSTDDAQDEADQSSASDGSDEPGDATSDMSSDAPGAADDTSAETGPFDDAIADAAEGGPVSRICALECMTTADCNVGVSVFKQICDPATRRCVNCTDDLPCIAGASVWTKSCTVDGDCTAMFGDYCVDVGGLGRCAFDSAKIGTFSCIGNASTFSIKKHGASDMVNVCAKLTTTCDLLRGRCEGPCTITCAADGGSCTNNCTAARGGKVCNATTKRCECASDNDCASPTPHCNLVTQQCECGSGGDCAPDG
ncbi:MAG TPA: hypothetical protein VGY54_17620, partial [Polyangiaceae bacterium]|nr:hypothetical protein [Polyangiaceae bacterium]